MAEKKTAAPTEGAQAPIVDDGMVEIELYRDNDKYNNDVTVIVNGKVYQIKRGEKVKVPKAVAEVLDNAKAQRNFATRTIDRLRDKSQN